MKKIVFVLGIISFLSLSAFAYKIVSGRTAEVEQRQGVFIYYKGQKPVDAYEYVGTVESGSIIKNYKLSYLVPMMLERTKKKYPEAEAIIFVEEDLWKCDVIRFKK